MKHLKNLDKIALFINEHHVLSLATSCENIPQVATLFYAYDKEDVSFVVASDEKTEHIQNVLKNRSVAGSIALETQEVGKIQGIQFRGSMEKTADRELYFKSFPYAKLMNPTLWKIKLDTIKYTDNRLGFGKKLYWSK